MFRLWAKEFKDNRMLKDTCITDDSIDTRTHKIFRALDTVCYEFDLGKPIWLDKTISEFKNSVNRGAEINFEWKEREYHICPIWPNGEVKYCITPLDTLQDTVYENADDMLEYMIGNDRLRDIITKVEVTDRTL